MQRCLSCKPREVCGTRCCRNQIRRSASCERTLAQVTIRSPVLLDEPFDRHDLHSRAVTRRVASIAALCVLLFAPAALVGCSSSHHAAKAGSQGDSPSSSTHPKNRLIVPGDSIAGISLGEPRKRVEKAFGKGKRGRGGFSCSFAGALLSTTGSTID